MARGKRKKKKSSQTNCEISSQEMDSHGTTTNDGQTPATTECICLSKSQKVRRFLLCCVATETPYCPIHKREGSNSIQKTKPRKTEKGTSKQPSRIRRIGRWLIKKMTKGKKEEHIPNEPIESTSATVFINIDDPPRLQLLCQQVLSVDGLEDTTQSNKANDIFVESESVSVTVVTVDVDVHCEFSPNELCRAVVTIDDDKKTSVTDSKQDPAYDVEQNTENVTEPDIYDINPEYEQHTLMTFKDMCKAAVTYYDAIKIGQTYDKEKDEPTEFELDNKGITPECDNNRVSSLTELCTKAISNADDRKPTEVENNDKIKNDDEPDTKDEIPECDTTNVMSLKEMCTTTIRTADGMTTTINGIESDQANDVKEADKAPECEKTMTLSQKELCSTAVRNADYLNIGTKDTTEEQAHNKELNEANENKANITEDNLECDKYAAKAFKDLCSAATRNVNDMKTSVDDTDLKQTSEKDQKESNDSKPSSYDVNHKSDNALVQSLNGLCLEAIEYADDIKPDVSGTLEDQSGENELNEVDDKAEEKTVINLDCIRNQAWHMPEDCTIATEDPPNMRISIYNTEQEQAYCKDQEDSNKSEPSSYDINLKSDDTSTQSLEELCLEVIGNADDVKTIGGDTLEHQTGDKDVNEVNDSTEENMEINPEYERNEAKSLAELCVAAIRNAGDVKTGINDTEIGHDYGRKQDKEFDTYAYTVKRNLEIGSNVVKYLDYLISAAVRNVDDMKNNIHDTNQEQSYDNYEEESNDFELDNYEINLKYDYVSTMFLKEPWMKAIRDADVKTGINDTEEDQAECKIKNKAYDTKAHTFEINPERGKNISMTLTELEQKDLTDNTDMNNTNITKQAHDLERTKESNENKAKYQPNDTGQVQATETVADRGNHIKQDRATGNMNNTADTANTTADDVEKDNKKDSKKDSTTETAHTTENDHQNVNTGGYIPGLFLHVPVEDLFQMILAVYNEGRCNTRTKHGNKGMMQRELNYRINMDQGISNHDVKAHADKQHIPRNIHEKRIRKRKCKIGQVDSNTGGNDCTDSDANKSRNPTAEIGVGARPKKRNLANENMIQAALKKTHDEAAIQSDCVVTGSKAATNIIASEAKRHVRRRQRKEAKPYTGGEHEPQPKPEPKLLSESHTEQKQDPTPCIDTGSSNIEISHGTHRKKKQKRRKAKWY